MKIKTIGERVSMYEWPKEGYTGPAIPKDQAVMDAWNKLYNKVSIGEIVPVELVQNGTNFDFFGDGEIRIVLDGAIVAKVPTGRHAADYADYTYLRGLHQQLEGKTYTATVVALKNGVDPVVEVEVAN